MHSIVTTFRGADIKVEVANFCAAMDTLIDRNGKTDEYNKRYSCIYVSLLQKRERIKYVGNDTRLHVTE